MPVTNSRRRLSIPIDTWPRSEQPQERLLRFGPENLTDAELLAIFIRTGIRGRNALEIGRRMLARFGSLRALLSAPVQDCLSEPGLGPARVAQLLAARELGVRCLAERIFKDGPLDSPARAGDYLRARLQDRHREVFVCVHLDSRHQVLDVQELFLGTIDGAAVYPREVVRAALIRNAAALIVAHNHPSGIAEPSDADVRMTAQLIKALGIVEVRLLDHLIIGDGGVVSLANRGLM